MNLNDVRIDYCRDASVHWQGRGRAVHLPTGQSVEFEDAWNNRAAPRETALKQLAEMVAA